MGARADLSAASTSCRASAPCRPPTGDWECGTALCVAVQQKSARTGCASVGRGGVGARARLRTAATSCRTRAPCRPRTIDLGCGAALHVAALVGGASTVCAAVGRSGIGARACLCAAATSCRTRAPRRPSSSDDSSSSNRARSGRHVAVRSSEAKERVADARRGAVTSSQRSTRI